MMGSSLPILARWMALGLLAATMPGLTASGPVLARSGVVAEGVLTANPGAIVPRTEGTWTWPVTGPVIRDFDPPEEPYGSGHRGIDIKASLGTPVRAASAGVVSFAGKVGGELYVTIDHGGGLRSTYSWLSAIAVRTGEVVPRGATIGATGRGHPDATVPHLHFGVRRDGIYVDPLAFLGPAPVSALVHLAPALPGA